MKASSKTLTLALLAGLAASATAHKLNSTYYNPVLPGWHSDPSCVQVDGTFFCVTSTFISFPGLPIYASKDLINWKHVSHVWNRESQLPGYSWGTEGQQQGMYAATIRHRHGIFYVICEYLGLDGKDPGVLFRTTDPFKDASWTDALTFPISKADPDLFWDDASGKVYVATQDIQLQEFDLATGSISNDTISLWNGTGGVWPEGPHLYKKDGYYYLMIAEGGTETNHSITIARSRFLTGPYAPCPNNPILTNRGTYEYFQTVGHGDLFQDSQGNWWGMCLATRSGPDWTTYPMGREAVLFPVVWRTGDWPVPQPVRGRMTGGWPLPAAARRSDLPGDGPFNSDPDVYDFPLGQAIPRNLVHWRVPRDRAFAVTERGLRVVLGRNDLAGAPGLDSRQPAAKAISFVGRRQTDSLFTYSVDLSFVPRKAGQEAGVVAFLTQQANVHLVVVLEDGGKLSFRFNASGNGQGETRTRAVPKGWEGRAIRMQIQMTTPTKYTLTAMLAVDPRTKVELGKSSAALLSGGTGSFVGTLLGIYATCNGAGSGLDCERDTPKAYLTRWRYTGVAQYISETEAVPSKVDLSKPEV